MLNGRGPPLTALQAFVAVAEHGSVREAARRLGVVHSVVARHLQTVNHWAGSKLVETGPGGATLTEEGRMIFAAVGPAYAAIDRLGQEIRPDIAAAPLIIWCAPGVASRWLLPRLDNLRADMGGRDILIRPSEQRPDLDHGEADAALVYAPPDVNERLDCVTLGSLPFFAVASPSWVALNGVPAHTEAFMASPLIHEHSDDQWRRWLQAGTANKVGPLPGPRLWYANMALEAAEHGQGIALANVLLSHDAIESGRLVRLGDRAITLDDYQLLVSSRRARSPIILKLKAWFQAQFAAPFSAHTPGETL